MMKFENMLENPKEKEVETSSKEDNVSQLQSFIQSRGMWQEFTEAEYISPEEEICIQGIRQILEMIRNKTYDRNDINNFDILHKNLRMIKGQAFDNKKQKKADVKELLRIVNGEKN